jgi:hypothetical protein
MCASPTPPFTVRSCLIRNRCLTQKSAIYRHFRHRRRGRVAEGGGLLNRYRVSSPIKGSNPFVSAKTVLRPPSPLFANLHQLVGTSY